MLGHQTLSVCKISDSDIIYLLRCLRYGEHGKVLIAVGWFCHLQTANMLIMGLALKQILRLYLPLVSSCMQSIYLHFIMFARKLQCFEHTKAYWVMKMFVKFQIRIY